MDPEDLYEQYRDDRRRQDRKDDDRREERRREDFKKEMEQRNRIETARRQEILRLARKGNIQAVFAGLGIPYQPPPVPAQPLPQPPPMGVSPGGPGPKLPSNDELTHADRDIRTRARSQAIGTVLNDASLTPEDKALYLTTFLQMFETDDMLREVRAKSQL
jgi:hypothetical protein